MYQLIGAFSKHEREIIRSRVKSGMAAAKRRGLHVGRKPVAVDAAEVKRLRESGLSVAAIAKRLGIGAGTAFRTIQAAYFPFNGLGSAEGFATEITHGARQ